MTFNFDKEEDDIFFSNIDEYDNNFLYSNLDNRYNENMGPFDFQGSDPFLENYNNYDIDRKIEGLIADDSINKIINNNKNDFIEEATNKDILFDKTMDVTKKKDINESFLGKKRKEEPYRCDETPKVNKNKIFEIYKEEKKKTKKGRNKKNQLGGKHNKFSSDNMVRRIKVYLFAVLIRFINESIKKESEAEENNPKENSKKFLLKVNQEIIININVVKNLKLLDSELKNIFSNDVSKKVEAFGIDV